MSRKLEAVPQPVSRKLEAVPQPVSRKLEVVPPPVSRKLWIVEFISYLYLNCTWPKVEKKPVLLVFQHYYKSPF